MVTRIKDVAGRGRFGWKLIGNAIKRSGRRRKIGLGGRGTLAGERGVGRVLIPTRGHTLWLCC